MCVCMSERAFVCVGGSAVMQGLATAPSELHSSGAKRWASLMRNVFMDAGIETRSLGAARGDGV